MRFDPAGNDLERMLSQSEDVRDWLHELAERGADSWAVQSVWKTGHNATHIRTDVDHGMGGDWEATIHAWGHYARWREHGTRWNAPERVISDYLRSIDPDADIRNP